MPLPSGVPSIENYLRLSDSALYREIAAFSEQFLARNRLHLRAYRWAPDPMRQWSRRWEYPFCVERLEERFSSSAPNGSPRILDAGSGITFFPYFLASKGYRVSCCDIDGSLARLFTRVNGEMGVEVPFTACSLTSLAFDSGAFDAVSCLSVLEHCDDRERILGEIARVLRPGGLLVLSFDISLDGRWEIPVPEARALLHAIGERFSVDGAAEPAALLDRIDSDALLTTRFALRHDPRSLPWGLLSDLKSLAHLKVPRRPHKDLSVCTISATLR